MRPDSAGPKAESLRGLAEAGLPVPEWRTLPASAYAAHARRAGVPAVVAQAGRTALDAALVREAIVATPLETKLVTLIRAVHRELGGGPVAVRSSAYAEDLPGASFAGQHGTYFVGDDAQLLERVRSCWASLFSQRAVRYREQVGIGHDDLAMCVIVQRLVPARAAGVAFTSDPVNGCSDVLVEACLGLGETLVSGRVTPDRFVFSRAGLKPLSSIPGDKRVMLVADAGGSIGEVAVDGRAARLPAIAPDVAREVARLALRAETVLGRPADVEWAYDGRDVWLLQARPITTLTETSQPEAPAVVWSNVNAGEILPDVVTPMTWSVIHAHAQEMFGGMFRALGVRLDARKLIGLVGGRVYFDVTLIAAAFAHVPGLDLERVLGGMRASAAPPTVEPARRRRISWPLVRAALALPAYAWWHSPRRAKVFSRRMRDATEQALLRIGTLPRPDDTHAVQASHGLVKELVARFSEFDEALAYMLAAMLGFGVLMAVCERWLGDATGALANRLVAGRGDVASAEAGHVLWRLGAAVREGSSLREALLAARTWGELRPLLEHRAAAAGDEEAARFLREWDAFMAEHGHHRRGELEFANPTWAERPDYVLGVVRGYAAGRSSGDPIGLHRRRSEEAEAAADECRRRLDAVRRAVFDRALVWGRSSARSRENVKSEAVRWMAATRRALLAVGEALAARGTIPSAEDVFYLGYDELAAAVASPGDDLSSLVEPRRAEHDRLARLSPPPVVVGEWREGDVDDTPEPAGRLEGISVSAGVARGRARVLSSAEGEEGVLPGEILVAPFTDPGWTPYFIPAAGIVMDLGGVLSHGSIIAREYGIPAVVNVGRATRMIRTGDLVEVDGDRGVVSIIAAGHGPVTGPAVRPVA